MLRADGAAPGEQLEGTERGEAVRQAIARLPDDLRTALLLSTYENLSHVEIADIERCTPKAIENRIARARDKLRTHLEKLPEFRA